MPSWILWLSPVVVAPALAVAWISWVSRPRGPEEAREGVEKYDRFKAALAGRPARFRHDHHADSDATASRAAHERRRTTRAS